MSAKELADLAQQMGNVTTPLQEQGFLRVASQEEEAFQTLQRYGFAFVEVGGHAVLLSKPDRVLVTVLP